MPKQDNIRVVGLENYLNNTATEHNGLDYAMFVKLHEVSKIGPNNLARAFLVTKNTVLKWLAIHNEEKTRKVLK